MTKPSAGKTSSFAVFRTLQWMRKNKFRPVPLHYQSKAAAIRDYVQPDYKPPDDDLWKTHNYGVGCVTGPAHHGPVDIDLDCKEAVFFATYFMPPTTAIFGRDSKPKSHYIYRVDTPTFKHEQGIFKDPVTKKGILEVRGDGGLQTMFPGSVHEGTGELINWASDRDDAADLAIEVPIVKADDLLRAARKTALAALIAIRGVWTSGSHNRATLYLAGTLFHLQWTLEEVQQFIQALMDWDNDRDKSRMLTVKATFKKAEAGGKIAGQGVLRKEVNNRELSDRILELAGSPTVNLVNEYNEHYATVIAGGKFRIINFEEQSPKLMTRADFVDWKRADWATGQDGKLISKAKHWLDNPLRRSYKRIDFLPGQDVPGVFNLWEGWGVEPSKEGSCEAWLELLHDIICGGDDVMNTWMLNWLANIVREPQHKTLTAPVIIGKQGAGKTLLLSMFGKILGKGYTVVTNDRHVHGHFNAHLQHTLLLHSEEALFGGDKKHLSIIKSAITDEWQMIEPKGVDPFPVRNFMRLVLASNELRAAPVEANDRRFVIFDLVDRILSEKLRVAVDKEKHGNGPARLFQFLLDYDYKPEIARTNIKNDALLRSKQHNWDAVDHWWHKILEEGVILPDELRIWDRIDEITAIMDNRTWSPEVSSSALHVSLVMRWQAHRSYGSPPSETLLAIRLDKFLGIKLERKQRRGYPKPERGEYDPPLHPLIAQLSTKQYTIINLPSLNECRKAFERYVGQLLDWPEDDDTPPTKPEF